jgi:hypothetical protein
MLYSSVISSERSESRNLARYSHDEWHGQSVAWPCFCSAVLNANHITHVFFILLFEFLSLLFRISNFSFLLVIFPFTFLIFNFRRPFHYGNYH